MNLYNRMQWVFFTMKIYGIVILLRNMIGKNSWLKCCDHLWTCTYNLCMEEQIGSSSGSRSRTITNAHLLRNEIEMSHSPKTFLTGHFSVRNAAKTPLWNKIAIVPRQSPDLPDRHVEDGTDKLPRMFCMQLTSRRLIALPTWRRQSSHKMSGARKSISLC